LKERGNMRTDIEGIVPDAPGLQGRSRHLELFGGLTLGEALGSQRPVLLKEVRTFESIPVWLALRGALLLVLDDGSHSDLLCQSLAFE
jgi:hypothetical protein